MQSRLYIIRLIVQELYNYYIKHTYKDTCSRLLSVFDVISILDVNRAFTVT